MQTYFAFGLYARLTKPMCVIIIKGL